MLLKEFYDNVYDNTGFSHTRVTARALVFNDKGEVGLMHIKGHDIFGDRDHYETPGGGLEGHEKPDHAILRELEEEIGYRCTVDHYLGSVINRYNLLEVITVHHFYIAHIDKKTAPNWTEAEKMWFDGVVWKTPKAWLTLLSQPVEGVNQLVHEREHFILDYALNQSGMLQG